MLSKTLPSETWAVMLFTQNCWYHGECRVITCPERVRIFTNLALVACLIGSRINVYNFTRSLSNSLFGCVVIALSPDRRTRSQDENSACVDECLEKIRQQMNSTVTSFVIKDAGRCAEPFTHPGKLVKRPLEYTYWPKQINWQTWTRTVARITSSLIVKTLTPYKIRHYRTDPEARLSDSGWRFITLY